MTEKLETFIKIGKTFFRHKNEVSKEFIQEFRFKDIVEVWRYRRGRKTWEFKGKNFILIQLN